MFWSEAFLFPNIKLNFWSLTAIVNYVIVTLSLSCLSKAKVIKQDSLSKYMLHKISHGFSPMSILRLLALSAAQQTQSSHSHSKWAEKISLQFSWVMCVFSKDIPKISQKISQFSQYVFSNAECNTLAFSLWERSKWGGAQDIAQDIPPIRNN